MNVEKFIDGLHDYLSKQFAPLVERIKRLEERAPEKGEKGDKGEDGAPGKDGRDGVDGAPGRDGDKGIDGKDGLPGRDGVDGKDGSSGRDGVDGKDGQSVTLDQVRQMWSDMYSKQQAEWSLDFERRAQDLLHRFMSSVPKPENGKDGRDGVDGMGFDDIEVTHDGERAFTISVVKGDRRKDFSFTLPVILEKGVWKIDSAYEKGDGVTFGGNYWIAQKNEPGKPGEGDGWRLAVRRGRDGKDR